MAKENSVKKVDDSDTEDRSEEGLSFEDALQRLELAVKDLEDGGLSLEQALNKFEEGIRISRLCTHQLEKAKLRIETLLEEDGKLSTEPFESDEEGNG